MHITLAVHHFPPRYTAGAENYTLRLAKELAARGHKIEVVCIEAVDVGEPDVIQAVKEQFQGIAVWRLSFNLYAVPDHLQWSFDNPLLGQWFADYFATARPDLVHFQAGYLIGAAPLRAAARAEIPIVLTLHDFWFLCPRITLQRGDGTLCQEVPANPAECTWCMQIEKRRYRYLDRWTGGMMGQMATLLPASDTMPITERRRVLTEALQLANVVIAPSHFLGSWFRGHVEKEKLRVIELGAPFPTKILENSSSTKDRLRIGYIGQIAPHKGVHLLLEALKKLRTGHRLVQLDIYGHLAANQDYSARLHKLKGNDQRIHFRGRFMPQDIDKVMAQVDILVVPSIWYENSPMVIHEAFATGVPVITAAMGGMAELVESEVTGLHFAPADATDLACQLQRLIDEPELLKRLRRGVAMHKQRTITDEVDEIIEAYASIVKQGVPQ